MSPTTKLQQKERIIFNEVRQLTEKAERKAMHGNISKYDVANQ
jgi:hypothetical protein